MCKFKKGDIVTFYESMHPWIVTGYHRMLTGELKVDIKRIQLPSCPEIKEVPGYADESDLILS